MCFQEISTCGKNPTTFSYKGDAQHGVLIQHQRVSYEVIHKVFEDLLTQFAGRTIPGGFSMTAPISGGVGEYLSHQSIQALTPRHGSFICAILRHEKLVTCSMSGNSIMVHF